MKYSSASPRAGIATQETFLPKRPMTAGGREYSVTTGRFHASEFQWQLSGDELDGMTGVSRPVAVRRML